MKGFNILIFFLVIKTIQAQNDSINRLEEVLVDAVKKFKNTSNFNKKIVVTSVLKGNSSLESFTSLLRNNTSIYFKENGLSGSSSISFRGTGASGTAVTWNGVNINSVNNGQTDFNSFSVSLNDNISVKSGGDSVSYGSGAIGGSIHLSDFLFFSNKQSWEHQFLGAYSSFSTFSALYKTKFSSEKVALNLGITYNHSENDYPFFKSRYKNTNGAYHNSATNFSFGVKISDYLNFKLYSFNGFSNRFFSGELPNPTSANDKYIDTNHRNLIALNYLRNKFKITSRAAYLFQKYQFFDDKNSSSFSYGSSDRYITDLHFIYTFSGTKHISLTSKYEKTIGITDSSVKNQRDEFTQSLVFEDRFKHTIDYIVKLRKDYNSDYKIPFSYYAGVKFKPIKNISLRSNFSKNFRVPTYNDLYWPNMGNKNLVLETSKQAELAVVLNTKVLFIDLAYFKIKTKDKIVWSPNAKGVWRPSNIDFANISGIEFLLNYKFQILNKIDVNSVFNYSYTNTVKQIFVPKHLANLNFNFNVSKFKIWYQYLFNGEVFTTESHSPHYVIDAFMVSNLGVNYKLKSTKFNQLIIGFKLNNFLNENYVIVQNRPMPGVNYNLNINYKF